MDLKSIKPIYLAGIAVLIVIIAAALIWVGFAQPTTSEGSHTGDTETWEVQYLGIITSQITEENREKHIEAFIDHNTGVMDACEIMHFYSYSCAACQRVEPWLNAFRERYPEVPFTSYEIHESSSMLRLEAAKMEYGMSSASVPIIFICGSVIEGVDAIENAFEPMALSVYNLPVRS